MSLLRVYVQRMYLVEELICLGDRGFQHYMKCTASDFHIFSSYYAVLVIFPVTLSFIRMSHFNRERVWNWAGSYSVYQWAYFLFGQYRLSTSGWIFPMTRRQRSNSSHRCYTMQAWCEYDHTHKPTPFSGHCWPHSKPFLGPFLHVPCVWTHLTAGAILCVNNYLFILAIPLLFNYTLLMWKFVA